jgi:hypothetical protein
MFYTLSFYVPESHCEEVKKALFTKGAGTYEKYDCCSWQVLGQGQFRPLEGSHPYRGEKNSVERVSEYKVEMVCDQAVIVGVLEELKKVHPYEEVAYHVHEVKTLEDF